jgi:hypothetical protein
MPDDPDDADDMNDLIDEGLDLDDLDLAGMTDEQLDALAERLGMPGRAEGGRPPAGGDNASKA